MSECPAAFMHLQPKPLNLVRNRPAGVSTEKKRDSFQSCIIVPSSDFMVYTIGKKWNLPESRSYSAVPSPIVGEPFDTSKPRKGRWGETVGTKSWYDSALFDETWDNMQISQKDKEEIALEDARKDLQRRIEICLYGTPRLSEIKLHPCQVRRS